MALNNFYKIKISLNSRNGMNENCLFFTPFTYMKYEEEEIVFVSTGKNPFDTPLFQRSMKKKKLSFSVSAYQLFFNLCRYEEITKKKANSGFI